MKSTITTVFLLPLTFAFAQSDEDLIREKMTQQEVCWNAGDLDCFMETYWNSEQLLFIGSKGLTYGWQQTLDNYRKGYPNKEAMGKLSFDLKKFEKLSKNHWFVVGQWKLSRSIGDLDGHFSLIWKKFNGEWLIVADHSS
ncbi:MAG: nuclear transport factor 2 family protein [Cyclobacteriaceae bacterium]